MSPRPVVPKQMGVTLRSVRPRRALSMTLSVIAMSPSLRWRRIALRPWRGPGKTRCARAARGKGANHALALQKGEEYGKLIARRALRTMTIGTRKADMRGPLLLAFLLLAGCDDAPGEWAAIVYPDRTDRTRFEVTPRFKTFAYCRDQAIERMKAI